VKRLFILGLAIGSVAFGSSGVSGSLRDDGPSGWVSCEYPGQVFGVSFPFGGGSGATVGDAVRRCLESGGHPIQVRVISG
jgi:hypothetical protein